MVARSGREQCSGGGSGVGFQGAGGGGGGGGDGVASIAYASLTHKKQGQL